MTPRFILDWIEFAISCNASSSHIIVQTIKMLERMEKEQNSRTYPGAAPDQTCEDIISQGAAEEHQA